MTHPSSSVPPFHLVKLTAEHPVHAFTCGTRPGAGAIDEYLRDNALTEQGAGLSTVWVAVDPGAKGEADVIVGYFTLSPVSVKIVPAVIAAFSLPPVSYPIGGYLLGRLGVAERQQGKSYGSVLVAAAIRKARALRAEGGGVFLYVDPKNEHLSAWYQGLEFGFSRVGPNRERLALKL